MKTLSIIISILLTMSASCQTKKEMNLDYIRITPMGISDLPRDTLHFSIKGISSRSISTIKIDELSYKIITDLKTMTEMAIFITKNIPDKKLEKRDFSEYGCFNITGYYKDSLIVSYNLNRFESRKYLNSLLETLVKSNLDIEVIKALKKRCLEPIDY